MQAFFADSELNARVYTLDADSGYKVQNKTVGGGRPMDDEEDEHSSRLSFPKKARRGETHGRARLSRDDVIAIRAWAAQFTDSSKAPPWTEKAAAMHVSEGTLRDIVNRRTWTHVH